MTDTAQPVMAAENARAQQVQTAADAFKAFTVNDPIVKPAPVRDEQGRFAAEEPEADESEQGELGEPEESGEDAEATQEPEEAAEEAQPDPLPASWSSDKAELWAALPAEAREYIVARDAEQARAVGAKFQEAANVRKMAEAETLQAQATRAQQEQVLNTLLTAVQPVEPDPREYGAGTGQYDREGYDLAVADYRARMNAFGQLFEQHRSIQQQQQYEAQQQVMAQKQAIEAEYAPKFIEEVPELSDPMKVDHVLNGLINFANQNGIGGLFSPDNAVFQNSAVLRLLWKAQQYDDLKAKTATVPPKPKPATPAVRPGVSSSASAHRNVQAQKVRSRLASEGSIDAGAAMWKQLLKG